MKIYLVKTIMPESDEAFTSWLNLLAEDDWRVVSIFERTELASSSKQFTVVVEKDVLASDARRVRREAAKRF